MSFPASPSNGQTAIVNNIAYTYSSTNNSWARNPSSGALTYFNTNGAFVVSNTTTSTSATTGAFVINGGLGIQDNINVAKNATINGILTSQGNIVAGSITNSTGTTTGALVVAGGAGIAANLFVGGSIYVVSNAVTGTTTRIESNVPHPFMLMGV